MRSFLVSVFAASTALTFTSGANAADVVYEAPMAPAPMEMMPVSSGWTGFYIGVQGGGAFNPQDPDNVELQPNGFPFAGSVIEGAFGSNFDSNFDSSFLGGAHIGYDYQINNVVLGVVADINALDITRSSNADSSTPAFYRTDRDLNYLGTVRARAGYLVTPKALGYVTGGLAYGDVDYSFSTNSPAVTAGTPAVVTEDEDNFGYTVGAGMEVMFTENMTFGAEYLYTNLGGSGSTRLNGGPFAGGVGGSTDFTVDDDFDFHTVTAKISYKFN
ncbi:outer membrane protein [Jiella mangrovi]|uniref:Porin family protein n=1 Tax=Jiella mangrovi TaxID=2821407 RepID=A0ABS4BCV2_9HYPH|nr:outer membrane beta-barrel protein [Jiella mangrovi]MBP0614001.1 porin family protein [Jiella mangrovi]